MRKRILPYKMGSQSCKMMAGGLGILRLKTPSRFIAKSGDIIINWGNSSVPAQFARAIIINDPSAVRLASNKAETFWCLSGNTSIPAFTQIKETAQQWVNEGHRVYGRKTLTGHSGQGIVIFNEGDIVTDCLLYTKNTKAKYEYRIHVMNGTSIDIQQKKKREGYEGGIAGIRNFANGWVFARENINVPECVKQEGLKAVQALGLDFGAVDVGYVEREDKAYVYEVNTAPGLEGTTLERYVQAFKEHYNV